jgi:ABC-type multidrug transport system fused ATPase/permease subunit
VNLEQKISNFSLYNETTEESESELATERDYVLYLLAAMIILTTVFNLGRTFGFYTVMRRASINIHKHMITNVMNATMQFFDSNFIGNILNRFSKDLTVIDEHLPFIFHQVFRVTLVLILLTMWFTTPIPDLLGDNRRDGLDRNRQHVLPSTDVLVSGGVANPESLLSQNCAQFEEAGCHE